MNKYYKLLYDPKLTGKKYLCISLDIVYLDSPEYNFEINKTYLEVIIDQTGNNYSTPQDGDLILLDKNNLHIYVNRSCFMLLKEKVHPLALLEYNIN